MKGVSSIRVPSFGSSIASAVTGAATSYATAKFGNSAWSKSDSGGTYGNINPVSYTPEVSNVDAFSSNVPSLGYP